MGKRILAYVSWCADNRVYKIAGSRVTVPTEVNEKSYVARVFDISGKLLYNGIIKNGVVVGDGNAKIGKGLAVVEFIPKQ